MAPHEHPRTGFVGGPARRALNEPWLWGGRPVRLLLPPFARQTGQSHALSTYAAITSGPPATSRVPWSPPFPPLPAPGPSSGQRQALAVLRALSWATRGSFLTPHSLPGCNATGDRIPSVPQLQGGSRETSAAHPVNAGVPRHTQTHLARPCQEARTQNGRCGGEGGAGSGRNARGTQSHLTEVRRQKRLPGVSGTRKKSTGQSRKTFCTGTKTSDVSTDPEDGKEAEMVSMIEKHPAQTPRQDTPGEGRSQGPPRSLPGPDRPLGAGPPVGCGAGAQRAAWRRESRRQPLARRRLDPAVRECDANVPLFTS